MDEEFKGKPCFLCGSEDKAQLPVSQTPEQSVRKRVVSKCLSCGLVYADSFSEEERENYFKVLPLKSSPDSFDRALKWIERFRKPSRLLEVGAYEGLFLKTARARGWNVYGVEENSRSRAAAKSEYGMFINPGGPGDLKKFSGFFDLVVLWNVLEVSDSPEKLLKECSGLLKRDGILYVNYVDYDSFASRMSKSRWTFLSEGRYCFSRPVMERLLRNAGFEAFNHRIHWQKVSLGFLTREDSGFLKSSLSNFLGVLNVQNLNLTLPLGMAGVVASKKGSGKG